MDSKRQLQQSRGRVSIGNKSIDAGFRSPLVYDRCVIHQATSGVPTIPFGAFHRHNLDDMLFAHITQALLGGEDLLFAGLAMRDMRGYGGHQVDALAQFAARWRECRVNILHAGGELLTCDAWQSAVMSLPTEQAQRAIARFDAYPQQALEWARGELGLPALAPYTVRRSSAPISVTMLPAHRAAHACARQNLYIAQRQSPAGQSLNGKGRSSEAKVR